MKTLIMTITLLASSAWAKDIATYNFAIHDTADKHLHSFKAIVTDFQELKVEVASYKLPKPPYFGRGVVFNEFKVSKLLNELTYSMLLGDIKSLANTEITKERAEIVCMMIATPWMYNDSLKVARNFAYDRNFFMGELELVLGPQGCWVSNKVYPKAPFMKTKAERLKSTIKALGLELAGANL